MSFSIRFPFEDTASLLPHGGHMVLLDRILYADETSLEAEAVISENHIFLKNGVLPVTVGLEIMAQGIAALDGLQARCEGRAIRMGFLLGTRRLEINDTSIGAGSRLKIRVVESVRDASGMAVFDATMDCVGEGGVKRILQAALSVYAPQKAHIL